MRVLIFDLDDTLLDTTQQLLPYAYNEALDYLIAQGLKTDLQKALDIKYLLLKEKPRQSIFKSWIEYFGFEKVVSQTEILESVEKKFQSRDVEKHIHLADGVNEMLKRLQKKYKMYLVTAGSQKTQNQKIELLEIRNFFEEVLIVDQIAFKTKLDAFCKILSLNKFEAQEFLSIGNRLDTDIAPAKSLGMQACWVRYGEHSHFTPGHQNEWADFETQNVLQIEEVCRL